MLIFDGIDDDLAVLQPIKILVVPSTLNIGWTGFRYVDRSDFTALKIKPRITVIYIIIVIVNVIVIIFDDGVIAIVREPCRRILAFDVNS